MYGAGIAFITPSRFALLGNIANQSELESGTVGLNFLNILGFGLGPVLTGFILSKTEWSSLFFILFLIWGLSLLLLVPLTKLAIKTEPISKKMLEKFDLKYIINEKKYYLYLFWLA